MEGVTEGIVYYQDTENSEFRNKIGIKKLKKARPDPVLNFQNRLVSVLSVSLW